MKQLPGLDASFLYLETAQMPMHVGALQVLELPAGHRGRFVNTLRKHIAERLPLTAVLRRRLCWMPLNLANPAWVDAEPELDQHIVEVKLPALARRGDGMAALEACVSELHPVLLDRQRPLWKMHVLEGLSPGPNGRRRVGLYTQLHHAAVDGQAAVALAGLILDASPNPPAVEARAPQRQKVYQLGAVEMLRGALGNEVRQIASIVTGLPGTLGTLSDAARQALADARSRRGGDGKVSNLTLAPATPLNVSIGATRSFAALSLPLPVLKSLGKLHGATINDLLLMLIGTALRNYLATRRKLPAKSLVAAVPVSLRDKGDRSANTQASMSLMSLGTHIAEPGRRLQHVLQATRSMKSTIGSLKSVLPTDFPSIGVPWLIEAATALVGKARLADRLPQLANLVISNVPGPPLQLYLAGARLVSNYPTSIITHGLALNITAQSYHESLDLGLMADAKAMPDVRALADGILAALDEVLALPMPGESAAKTDPARKKSTAGKKRPGAGKKTVTKATAKVPAKSGKRSRASAQTAPRGSR